jgi:hypothetical protein
MKTHVTWWQQRMGSGATYTTKRELPVVPRMLLARYGYA